MRRGCGCLLGLLALAIGLGTLVWAATFLLGSPEPAAGTPWTAADLSTARRKLDALRRQEGPLLEVALSERELAAIATRHLAEELDPDIPEVSVRIPGRGTIHVGARLPIRYAADEIGLGWLIDLLPRRWGERPLWVQLDIAPRFGTRHGRRFLRLDATRLYLGRLRVPSLLHRIILRPSVIGSLELGLPVSVQSVTTEPGRLVLRQHR